jgi:hypothetical protein
MAVGGTGEPSWLEEQRKVSKAFGSLEDYLAACSNNLFGDHDMLYQTVKKEGHPWLIAQDAFPFVWPAELGKIVTTDGSNTSANVTHGIVLVGDKNAKDWLLKIAGDDFRGFFLENANDCNHWLVPLVWPTPDASSTGGLRYETFGFVLVDNPYLEKPEVGNALAFTRLVCNLFAGLLAVRMHGVRTEERPLPPEIKELQRLGLPLDQVNELIAAYQAIPAATKAIVESHQIPTDKTVKVTLEELGRLMTDD